MNNLIEIEFRFTSPSVALDVPEAERYVTRRWPSAPRVGDKVFLREIVGVVIVDELVWGNDSDDVSSGVKVVIACRHLEDGVLYENRRSSSLDLNVLRKLTLARATLMDVKAAIREGWADGQRFDILISDTLDSTAIDAAVTYEDREQKVKELENEVASLRRQLAVALAPF